MSHGRTPSETLALHTLALVRELDDCELCTALADPGLTASGGAGALEELRLFLAEQLLQQPPAELARFTFPAGTRLEEIDVELRRRDLPRRAARQAPVTVPCAVVPHGADCWVLVPAIRHVVHVAGREPLEATVRAEIQRMVAAMELTPSSCWSCWSCSRPGPTGSSR